MAQHYSAFHPGQLWLDTEGKRIQAHGGSVFYEDGVYYWYGENKEKTTGDNGIWQWGVRCYRSTDLYNWQDLGVIIPPSEDPRSSLHPTSMMDRPHILKCPKTGKYVCWMKIMHRDGRQTQTIMQADSLLGPYTLVQEGLQPLGMNAGDFDLAVDAETGKGYYIFEHVHSETVCAELNEEFTDVTGVYSTHFHNGTPPFVREATAHFFRRGKHYLVTSGTTGYLPNPSEAASSDRWHGPYHIQGNPHVDDPSDTSFHSQISCIFPVAGKEDCYIAIADRWVPELMYLEYPVYRDLYYATYGRGDLVVDMEKLTPEQKLIFADSTRNTSIANYVWLPLEFDGEQVRIRWKDTWKLEE